LNKLKKKRIKSTRFHLKKMTKIKSKEYRLQPWPRRTHQLRSKRTRNLHLLFRTLITSLPHAISELRKSEVGCAKTLRDIKLKT
jgi:hypothetical protein